MLPNKPMTLGLVRCNVVHPQVFSDLSPVFPAVAAGKSIALLPPHPTQVSIAPPDTSRVPHLGVTSSGSSGTPKLIWRDWSELLRNTRTTGSAVTLKWGSPYKPETFAGCQVALQAWVNGTTAVSLSPQSAGAWAEIRRDAITALSCTPTYLYLLLLADELPSWEPAQITLGGEPLSTAQGTLFIKRFPSTRFTVTYASAEHGLLLKTSRTDGWFETSFLDEHQEWKIENGELQLRVAEKWISTRDRVELKGSLLRILGRADAVANIAGQKYSLALVARAAENCEGVVHARAGTEQNPVTGEIVTLSLTLLPSLDERQQSEVLSQVQTSLRAQLPKGAWPRRWVVEQPGLGKNSKELL